jgi:DNA replication and repair protein RecF
MFLESIPESGEKTVFTEMRLTDFRNYATASVEFDEGLNIVIGKNAQGKSNLLEAISVVSTTRSFRGAKDRAMIRSGCDEAIVSTNTAESLLTLRIPERGRRSAMIGKNEVPRVQELIGRAPVISFASIDLELITGEPSWRRRFLDLEISQLSARYLKTFTEYRRQLEQRNALLKQVRDGFEELRNVDVWNRNLSISGAILRGLRASFIESLSEFAMARHAELSGNEERLSLGYSVHDGAMDEASLLSVLNQRHSADVAAGTTTAGPHRDDLTIEVDGRAANAFASQGQQRTAVLAIKLAQMDHWRAREKRIPALLLDDIMSDLDSVRRRQVLRMSSSFGQVFVTATDLESVRDSVPEEAAVLDISDGTVIRR